MLFLISVSLFVVIARCSGVIGPDSLWASGRQLFPNRKILAVLLLMCQMTHGD